MRNYFRTHGSHLKIAFAAAALFAAASCTEVDDTLGLDLLPESQKQQLREATLGGIQTYLTEPSGIPTSATGYMQLGRKYSTDYGMTTCGAVVQYVPVRFQNDDYFGTYPQADSMKITFYAETIFGGSTPQKFYIYELTQAPRASQDYYPDFDAQSIIDPDPIFSFELGEEYSGYVTKMMVSEGTRGTEFLQRLVDTDPSVYKADDYGTEFRKQFFGFYIAPAPLDPAMTEDELKNMAVYDIKIGTTSDDDYAMTDFFVYAHDATMPPEKAPAIAAIYTFDDIRDTSKTDEEMDAYYNASINVIAHDYTTPGCVVDPSLFVTEVDADTPTQSEVYVQGALGVNTLIWFSSDFEDALKGLLNDAKSGETYSKFMVNKAEIVFKIKDADNTDVLDAAPARLGMYYDYTGRYPVPILDYQYTYESTYIINYGGIINRSNGEYRMDIRMYVNALVNELIIDPANATAQDKVIQIAPGMARSQMYNPGGITLYGSGSGADKEIKVILAYTLLK